MKNAENTLKKFIFYNHTIPAFAGGIKKKIRKYENISESLSQAICDRIVRVRMEVAGVRGKSAFAKKLGLSPSTYDYYEAARVPPAEVLIRIAEVAGVDLRWLLTGKAAEGFQVDAGHPVLQRAAKLLKDYPDASAPLAAFLDVLAETMSFPRSGKKKVSRHLASRQQQVDRKPEPQAEGDVAPQSAEAASAKSYVSEQGKEVDPHSTWIPILGRTAAGVPQFWSDPADAVGLTTLDQLVAKYARSKAHGVKPAISDSSDSSDLSEPQAVQIITLTAGESDDVVEFVCADRIKAKYDNVYAVRADGQSMSPDIRHGDLVILSPSEQAVDGKPAVVQLEGQIGVTCKIFRRSGKTVHLVPVDETLAPIKVSADKVIWAQRVLAVVKP